MEYLWYVIDYCDGYTCNVYTHPTEARKDVLFKLCGESITIYTKDGYSMTAANGSCFSILQNYTFHYFDRIAVYKNTPRRVFINSKKAGSYVEQIGTAYENIKNCYKTFLLCAKVLGWRHIQPLKYYLAKN